MNLTFPQRAAMLAVHLADKTGSPRIIRKVTADALVGRGLVEYVPEQPSHVRLTIAGHQYMEQFEFAPG